MLRSLGRALIRSEYRQSALTSRSRTRALSSVTAATTLEVSQPHHSRKFAVSFTRSLMCRYCDTTRVSSAASSSQVTVADTIACRLPANVRPSHYDVALAPNFETLKFDGHVAITVEVKEATTSITLNALEMEFLTDAENKPLIFLTTGESFDAQPRTQAVSVELQAAAERAVIDFVRPIDAGNYVLSINYVGSLNENLCGFYHSSYKRADGSLSHIGVTQFEATDCRRAVPSWDEPAVKATFAVTLIVPSTHSSISNMPVKSFTTTKGHSKESGHISRGLRFPAGSHRYTYYTTPLMSTYLLAFIVGEFEYLSAFTNRGVEIRVWTPVGKIDNAHFALDVSVRALEFYEKLFDINFPLPKVDVLAIPDFAAGAMENWGAITYREVAVLIDPKTSSTAIKQRVALTVSHELAHSWFGNLVTMEWWTQLYLNEGFARFTEHLAVDHLFPEWKTWDDFVTKAVGQALSLDALESSHAIEIPVTHPDQINEIFDTISYAKGSSVIRMLAFHIGVDKFFNGLVKYLKKHAYGNAVSNDLWVALSDASGVDVSALMLTWINEMGYPVITIDENTAGSKDGHRVIQLTQARFLASGKADDRPERLWSVPMSIGIIDNGKLIDTITHTLSSASGVVTIKAPLTAALKFNFRQTGFYRCQYSQSLFKQLSQVIGFLEPVDRLGLQRDSFALAMAGRVPITQALDLIQLLAAERESNLAVVQSYTGSLSYLTTMHSEETYWPQLQQWLSTIYAPALQQLGWEAKVGEDSLHSLYRSLVISQLGTAAYEPVVVEAKKRLTDFVNDPVTHPLAGDLRSAVYGIVSKNGGWAERETLLSLYRGTDSAEERMRILGSIGGVDDNSADRDRCIDANIDWAFHSDEIRLGDISYLIGSIAKNKEGRTRVWSHLLMHWDTIYPRYSKGQNFILADLLSSVLGSNKTAESVDQWEAWFREHPVPSAERALAQTAEAVRITAQRLQRDRQPLQDWLSKNVA